jgi:chromate reductase, NAD(P)H dehydrogenase (quinone)
VTNRPCRLLLISGSLRDGSTNTAVLRTAQVVAPSELTTVLYDGLGTLPHFNPDDDHDPLPVAAAGLRAQIGAADALLFATPEYAGALPGSFKNLLDWAVGDAQPRSIYNKPAGWINVSTTTGAVHAHDSLRLVLSYAHAAVVDAACVNIPVPRDAVGSDGLITDASIRTPLLGALRVLAEVACGDGEDARAPDRR